MLSKSAEELEEFGAYMRSVASAFATAGPHVSAEEKGLVGESQKFLSMLGEAALTAAQRTREAETKACKEAMARPSSEVRQGSDGTLVTVPVWAPGASYHLSRLGRAFHLGGEEGSVVWRISKDAQEVLLAHYPAIATWRRAKHVLNRNALDEIRAWVDTLVTTAVA